MVNIAMVDTIRAVTATNLTTVAYSRTGVAKNLPLSSQLALRYAPADDDDNDIRYYGYRMNMSDGIRLERPIDRVE